MSDEDRRSSIHHRGRANSPLPFRAVADAKIITNWTAIGALIVFVAGAAGWAVAVYNKMPSADQIAAIDKKHTESTAALQKQVNDHAAAISKISGQVGFLVRIEVAKANADDDPGIKQAMRQAAREAQSTASRPVQSGDPLAGIDLED